MVRTCKKCGHEKPMEAFAADPRCHYGRRHTCNACKYRLTIRGAPSQPSAGCERTTPQEEEALVAAQGGRCALCGKKRTLVLDHDHKTGKVRGMLCRGCNGVLGWLGLEHDFEAVVARLREYL